MASPSFIKKLKKLQLPRRDLFDSSFLFDAKAILKNTPDKDKLSVTIKRDKVKGNSLFATKPIEKGDTIAFYKMKVFTEPHKTDLSSLGIVNLRKICEKLDLPVQKGSSLKDIDNLIESNLASLVFKDKAYNVPYKKMYNFTVYNKNGYEYQKIFGDLYSGSLPPPKNNIPYWAYFSNEPSTSQKSNADIDIQSSENYTKQNRTSLKEGDTITYKIYATRPIEKGEEILWCYGSSYDGNRNYKTGC